MSVTRADGNRKGRKRVQTRKNALKDALPDVTPPTGIKEGDEDVPAENDEDDD